MSKLRGVVGLPAGNAPEPTEGPEVHPGQPLYAAIGPQR